MEFKTEGREVKRFLKDLGFVGVSVKHGTGTARYWLHIKVDPVLSDGLLADDFRGLYREVMKFTGRSGDHDGRIMIETNKQ